MLTIRATFADRADTVGGMTSDWQSFGHKDVACFAPAGVCPPGLDQALALSGRTHVVADIDTLDDDPPLSARLIWVVAVSDRDTRHFPKLRQRAETEALALVVAVPLTLLDAAWETMGDLSEVHILAAPSEADMLAEVARHAASAGAVLHSPLADARERQIEALQDEVQRIARMLARLSNESTADIGREPPSPFIEDHQLHAPQRSYGAEPAGDIAVATVSARDVRTVIRQRRLRDELFDPELFADPAWDMMLDLYAARLDRGRVSVSSLCIAAAVPATTALRWIKTLTDSGIFIRQADQHDGRRIFVALSDSATQAMHRYFARLSEARLAI